MSLGENIKFLREEKHLTQKELAKIAGVTDGAISLWEKGEAMPRVEKVRKIAEYFGLTATNFIETDGVKRALQSGKTKMSILFIMKSGEKFISKCEKFSLNKNILGEVTGYEFEGIAENKPVYLAFSEVAAIVRIMSDEQRGKIGEKGEQNELCTTYKV